MEGIEEPYEPVVGVEDISQTPGSLNDFLVLGAGGSVSWWQWGAGEARVRARAEETLQEARTMARALPARAFLRTSCLAPVLSSSLVQEGRIFLVTVALDCCLSLHEVSLQREGSWGAGLATSRSGLEASLAASLSATAWRTRASM